MKRWLFGFLLGLVSYAFAMENYGTTDNSIKNEKEFDIASLKSKDEEKSGPSKFSTSSPILQRVIMKNFLKKSGFDLGTSANPGRNVVKNIRTFELFKKRRNQKPRHSPIFSPEDDIRIEDSKEVEKIFEGLISNPIFYVLQNTHNSTMGTMSQLQEQTLTLEEQMDQIKKKQQSTVRDWIHEGAGLARSVLTVVVMAVTIWLMKKLQAL